MCDVKIYQGKCQIHHLENGNIGVFAFDGEVYRKLFEANKSEKINRFVRFPIQANKESPEKYLIFTGDDRLVHVIYQEAERFFALSEVFSDWKIESRMVSDPDFCIIDQKVFVRRNDGWTEILELLEKAVE